MHKNIPMKFTKKKVSKISGEKSKLIADFHKLWHDHAFINVNVGWGDRVEDFQLLAGNIPTYKEVGLWKNPLDLWLYQEIIYKTKPDFIIELGTMFGGSALFLADVCETFKKGHVITIDSGITLLGHIPKFNHQRITSIKSDCATAFPKVKKMVSGNVMVILDCDHSLSHVLKEMETYGLLVTPKCYLIVEDTDTDTSEFMAGPAKAVELFLEKHSDFEVDPIEHKFLVSQNPGGYLLRI